MDKYEMFKNSYGIVDRTNREWARYLKVSEVTVSNYKKRYQIESVIKEYCDKTETGEKTEKPIELQAIQMYNQGVSVDDIKINTGLNMTEIRECIGIVKRKEDNLSIRLSKIEKRAKSTKIDGREEKKSSEMESLQNRLTRKQKECIKHLLVDKYPLEIAKKLTIPPYKIYDFIEGMSDKERDSITKERLQTQSCIYREVQEKKTEALFSGKKCTFLDALRQIEDEGFAYEQLAEVYYILGAKNATMRIINRIEQQNRGGKTNILTRQRKECYKSEFLARDIRKDYQKSLKGENPISYDRLCKKHSATMEFVENILGKEKEKNR